jgi:hypothetical protein
MHRLGWTAAVALATGCTPPAPNARPTGPSPEPLTWKARAAFDSALIARDTTRVASLFAPGAFVIMPTGDTVPARVALPMYLAQAGADAAVRFSWGREGTLEQCVGGAREHLVYTARLTHPDSSSNTASGRLAVFWSADSAGALRVQWIAFPEAERSRKLTRAECPSVEAVVWRSWRWAASLYPGPGISHASVQTSFESMLRARGWTDRDCVCAGTLPTYTPTSDWTVLVPPSLVSVQYRARRSLAVELAGGRSPQGTTLGARTYPNRDYAHTQLWYSGAFLEAMVAYGKGPLQIGIGPVVQFSQWRLRDSLVPYSTGGLPTFKDFSWSNTPIGVVGDARLNLVVGSRAFLTLRAQARRFAKARTTATPRFAEAELDQSSSLVGVGFGVLW